ncbi:MAG: ArsR family transcriptional regulator [Dermatophilaceae bacterium]
MRTSAPPLLAVFRSQLQGELLARVLLSPGQLSMSDLARVLDAPVSTVAREVLRLVGAGLLTTRRVGRARLVAGNDDNPATGPLRELVMIAFGPKQVITEEFSDLPGVHELFIFGSWAARYHGEAGPPPGDVDVLVVGHPDRDAVYDAANRSQERLGREVNPVVVKPQQWQEAVEPFLQEVQRRPTLVLTRGQRGGTR